MDDLERIKRVQEALKRQDRASIEDLLTPKEKALIRVYDSIVTKGLVLRSKFDAETAEPLILIYYQALGYIKDHRSNAWLSSDGKSKIKILRRNIQYFGGERGAWIKRGSVTLGKAAENLVAAAAKLVGSAQAEKIVSRHKAQKQKAATRRDALEQKRLDDATSLLVHSKSLRPEQRLSWLRANFSSKKQIKDILGDDYFTAVKDTLSEIHMEYRLQAPPIFTENSAKVVETRIQVAEEVLPLIYQKQEENLIINIGGLPFNPLTMMPDFGPQFKGSGVIGYINFQPKKDPTAFLFMIISKFAKKGTGREILRTFCQAIRAYGLTQFVALAVGEEGAAFFNRLHSTGEIAIWKKHGSHWLISCQDIYTPGQRSLFNVLRSNPQGCEICNEYSHQSLDCRYFGR